MECVNCTACIDACDEVMTKINKPKGLIRFDSVEGVENKTKKLINARVLAYSAVLVILLCSMGFLLLSRSPVEASLTRTPGAIYQMKGDSLVSNMYQIELINKSFDSHLIAIELEEEQAQLFMPAGEIDSLNSQDKKTIYFFIEVPKNIAYQMNEKAHVKVLLDNTEMEVIKTSFPIPPSLKK
jgi:polyferredoxin